MISIRTMIPDSIKKQYRWLRAKVLSFGLKSSKPVSQSAEELRASSNVSVIVPIHDAYDVVIRCLHSLKKFGGEAEIILVDDGSRQPETVKVIDVFAKANNWRLIRNEMAEGHSRACEQGATCASRDYICLLNSDTVLTQHVWAGVVEAFESDASVAVVGPSTSMTCTRQRVRRAECCRLFWTDDQICSFAEKYVAKIANSEMVELLSIGGFAFFIRKSVWDEVGGFDHRLDDYGNESDLCITLRSLGYHFMWTRRSYIHHIGQQSYGLQHTHRQLLERRLRAKGYIDSKHAGQFRE